MALGRPLELRIRRRAVGTDRRLPIRVLVPAADLVALLGASMLVARLEPLTIAYTMLALLLLNSSGVRASRIDPRISEDIGWILGRLAIPLLLILPFASLDAGVGRLVTVIPLSALLVSVGRGTTYSFARLAKRSHVVGDRTLVVGAGVVAARLGEILQEHPEYGLRLIGFLDRSAEHDLPAPLLGGPEHLTEIVREFAVDRVIIAFSETSEGSLVSVLRSCGRLKVGVHFVPRFFELGGLPEGAVADDLWGVPVIPLAHPALRPQARLVKRVLDVTVASLVLALASPVIVAAAIAVRVSSSGPILFRQRRVGREGREFEIFKFRTMYENDESDTRWNVHDDERITPVGRVLRRLSIDELPQLLNVLRGDMSLVGPRPERPHYVGRFSESVDGYTDRHRVDVGITGWAQIHGRSRSLETIPERARFDNYYIEHWSLWRDLVIVARTIRAIFVTRG